LIGDTLTIGGWIDGDPIAIDCGLEAEKCVSSIQDEMLSREENTIPTILFIATLHNFTPTSGLALLTAFFQ